MGDDWWALQDLNLWPLPRQGSALPLSEAPTVRRHNTEAALHWQGGRMTHILRHACAEMRRRQVLFLAFVASPRTRVGEYASFYHLASAGPPLYYVGARWALSSGGERFLDAEEATGSNPVAPTNHRPFTVARSYASLFA